MTRDPLSADAIAARARAAGVTVSPARADGLAAHARLVLERNARLHLTTVVEPDAFLERHLGESFEGAALLDPDIAGALLDLGSGNGYPGIPLAAARPGLVPVLAESSARKAAFLREALEASGLGGRVLERSVQRAGDLTSEAPFAVLATRAAGGWERIVPRLLGCLAPGGSVLVFAGAALEEVLRRAAWRRLEPVAVRILPGRERARAALLVIKEI